MVDHPTNDRVDAMETRCECGHLVAKLRKDGVELKCKRCKRLVLIPFEAMVESTAHCDHPPASIELRT